MGEVTLSLDTEYAEKMVEFLERERTIPNWTWAGRIEFKKLHHEREKWIAEWRARRKRIVQASPAPGFNYWHC